MIVLNKQQLLETFDEVYFDLSKVPIDTIEFEDEFTKSYDGHHFLEKGDLKEYLIEPFKDIQPKSYQQLITGEFFYSIKRNPPLMNCDYTQFGILINDKVFYIKYFPKSYSSKPTYFKLKYIPKFILETWLYRSNQWDVAEEMTTSIYKSRLPSTLKSSIHSVLIDFEKKKNIDKNADFLTKKFNHDFRHNYDEDKYDDMEKYFNLHLILDTRNTDDFSETGFQLFLSTHNDKEDIYLISNTDVFSIKKLENAQNAIDSYASHIFSGAVDEFDFLQYAVDF